MEHTDLQIRGGGETARENLNQFIETQTINGVTVDIDLDYDTQWAEPYETLFEVPDGNIKYAVLHAGIAVDDWLAIQFETHDGRGDRTDADDWERFRKEATKQTVTSVADDIAAGDTEDIPTPILEINPSYKVSYAEGRSRGFGAKEAGLEMMPVWIAAQDYR